MFAKGVSAGVCVCLRVSARGVCLPRGSCHIHPGTDRHLWKYYLAQTSFVGGNNIIFILITNLYKGAHNGAAPPCQFTALQVFNTLGICTCTGQAIVVNLDFIHRSFKMELSTVHAAEHMTGTDYWPHWSHLWIWMSLVIPSMYTNIPILGSYTTIIWILVPTVTVDFDSRWGSAKIIQTRMVFCRGNPMRIEWPLSLLVICMNLPWGQ